jgi:branched-chain amino acid transport system permease protein
LHVFEHPRFTGGLMALATLAFSALYQFGDAFAFLVLSACGLAVIFGMMGVINLAHGEFIMCGAYVTVSAAHAGLPLPLAIAAGAIVSALVGALVEVVVIRHLYERPLDTIVATWGLSLIATQGTLIVLGSTMAGVGTPFGSFQVGDYSYSVYRLVLFAAAIAVLGGLYMLFNWTRFGVLARATIQVPHMAAALGVDTRLIYSLTFACGAGLAGLAGGLYAPTMTLVPTMGATFIMEAFVTVVVGGADVFLGTAPAAAVLAVVKSAMTSWEGQLFGQIGLLVAVIIVIRILPKGISGFLLRERT